MQPDLSAPGIDIIAAWSPVASPSEVPGDKRKVLYNIDSGTSMACPHASGAAAYVKSFHRDWSPAMIMSALITTGTDTDHTRITYPDPYVSVPRTARFNLHVLMAMQPLR